MVAWIRAVASRIRVWLSPNHADSEFARELEEHLALLTEENVRRGMGPEEAARTARMRLGGVTQLAETNRELKGLPVLETFLQDTRYALRMLRKNPGFTAVVVLTLALGIGANTAIFSVVYAVLLKPLPYAKPEQLVTVFQAKPQEGVMGTGWSYANFAELREQNHVFSEMAGSQFHQLTLTGRSEPVVVNASVVTPEVFSVLEEKPLAGRVLFADDGKRGAPAVAIISESFWREFFGADPEVLGTAINLDKRSFTVVGIMRANFRFPQVTESKQLWIPLVQDPLFGSWMERRGGHWLRVIARVKPGVSMGQVQAELDAIGARLAKEFPTENDGWAVRMVSLREMIVGNVKPALLVLLGAVGLVLLIACANIANLLLTRATSRAREIAVRATLGAGRARIVRQLLSETAVLGLLGGLIGIGLSYWGVLALSSLLPESVPRVNAIRVDNTVLRFALLLSAAASFAFGLAPAWFAANSNLQASMREGGGGRAGESGNRRRARNLLAAGEIALAMVLLVVAGLLLRSFGRLIAVSLGFDAQHIVKADISLPQFQYSKPQQWRAFADELLRRIQARPGLQDAAVAVPRPIVDGFINLGFDIVGNPPVSAGSSRTADYVSVSTDYFRVMGIPLMAGRFFDAHDSASAPRVSVISEAMARHYFPNQDPLGKRLTFGFPPDGAVEREIVGIVGDVRDVALGQEPGPMMYVPYGQAPFWGANMVVKSTLSASSVASAIREEVRKIDKDLPVTDVAAMPEIVEASLAQTRFRTFLLALFAGMALVLAATGIFGVISYSVSCRTNEIGIRVALGASSGSILGRVFRETLTLALVGLAIGLPCALGASHLIGHLLFGVSANDPATLGAVSLVLAATAVMAGYVPARLNMVWHGRCESLAGIYCLSLSWKRTGAIVMTRTLRTLIMGGVTLAALFLLAPHAQADIIEVEGATSCPGSLGGGLCNGMQAFNLSSLLVLLSQPNSIGAGTQKYVVFNDIGNTFSFSMTSTGQNNTGMANNAVCQINGGAKPFFNGCSIASNTGQTYSLGGPQINNLTFPATITFSGANAFGSTFILGFVSMQGSSSLVTVPEPSALALLAAAMLAFMGLATTTLRPR